MEVLREEWVRFLKYKINYFQALILGIFLVYSITSWSWLFGFIIFAIWATVISIKRSAVEIPPFFWLGTAFCISALISAATGLDISLSWNSTCLKLSYLFFWIIIWNFKKLIAWRQAVLLAITFVCFYYVFASYSRIITWYKDWYGVWNMYYPFQPSLFRIRGVRNYVNELAVFSLIVFPVLFVMIRYSRRTLISYFYAGIFSLMLLVFLYCRSRASWIAFVVEITIMSLLWSYSKRQKVTSLVSLSGVLCVSLFDDFHTRFGVNISDFRVWITASHTVTPIILLALIGSTICFYAEIHFTACRRHVYRFFVMFSYSVFLLAGVAVLVSAESSFDIGIRSLMLNLSSGRGYIWGVAVDAFRNFPFFGVGSGCFGRYWSSIFDSSNSFIAMHAHNQLLDLAATQGALGLLLFVVSFGYCCLLLIRKKFRARYGVLVVLVSGLVGNCSFDSLFTSPSNIVLLLLVVSIFSLKCIRVPNLFVPGPIGLVSLLIVVIPIETAFRLQNGVGEVAAADSFLQKGQMDSAIAYYRLALKERPKSALFHSKLGYALSLTGNYPTSLSFFEKSLVTDPMNLVTRLNISSLKLRMHDTVGFVEELRRARQYSRGAFEPYISMAILKYGVPSLLSKSDYNASMELDQLFPYSHLCQTWFTCRDIFDSMIKEDSIVSRQDQSLVPNHPLLAIIYHKKHLQMREATWLRTAINYDLSDISENLFSFYVVGAPFPIDSRSKNIYLYGIDVASTGIFPEFEDFMRIEWSRVQ